MRILLTGATGFAGGHLAEALLAKPDVELLGVSSGGEWPSALRHLDGRMPLRRCDLTGPEEFQTLLAEWRPEQILHLAGYAHAGRSFREADAAWKGNLDATRRLFDAVGRWGGSPRIVFVGSGLVYGAPHVSSQACDECYPLGPESPYAASKAAADLLAYQCWRSTGLEIVRARPFNHIGPRQSSDFAVAHFARQIVEIERGRRPPIVETGNLDPCRDLTDVRDMVRGYVLLMEKARGGDVYNFGSGQACSMREVLDRLLALAGARCEVRPRQDLSRATETAVLRADAGKARRDLGWSPRYSLEQTLAEILAYWRHAL